jgi:glycosyltransferase involved in cell wall biosynthesis
MPKIYIDCTETLLTGGITGIRRVTRQIITHRSVVSAFGPYEAVPVAFSKGRFYFINAHELTEPKSARISLFKILRGSIARHLSTWLTEMNLDFALSLLNQIIEAKLVDRLTQRRGLFGKPIDSAVVPGDLLFFCEYNCSCNLQLEIDKFHRSGGVVVSLFHDLLPLTHPEFFTSIDIFSRTFCTLVSLSDVIISVSNTTKKSVDAYMEMLRISGRPVRAQRGGCFYLGCDLNEAEKGASVKANPQWQHVFHNTNTFLVCGTLESRKNHSLILDAFDILWNQGKDLHLIFIGRYGWKTGALIKRLKEHPELNKRLYVITNSSDEELQFAYRSAKALIFASRAEGFGLPLVEALNCHLPVICSDIPIFHEIAGNNASFFDVNSARDLADRVNEFAQRRHSVPVDSQLKWPSWEESIRDLFSKIVTETSNLPAGKKLMS